jgi:uncharacterized membrane protein
MTDLLHRRVKLAKALYLVAFISFIAGAFAFYTQVRGKRSAGAQCSYLDPILIDLLAFSAALFLIFEGFYQIVRKKSDTLEDRILVGLRIAFGVSILVIHVLQFLAK